MKTLLQQTFFASHLALCCIKPALSVAAFWAFATAAAAAVAVVLGSFSAFGFAAALLALIFGALGFSITYGWNMTGGNMSGG